MGSIALTFLSLFLGFFYIFIGSMKLTPAISEEMHKEIKRGFKEYNKKFPFYQQTGWKPKTSVFRKTVGTTEVICGAMLGFIPGPMKQVANIVLMIIMAGAVYCHWAIGHQLNQMAPAIIFLLMLTCRFVVYLQVSARDKRATEAKQRSKVSTEGKKEQ